MSLLEVRDISVSFGGLQALDRVSLDVERGSVVGLIGPNGAGKTTLFNVISGLQLAEGSVVLDGKDISTLPTHKRAGLGLGRSFQNLGLMMEETVLTNVLAAQHISAHYRSWDVAVRPWRWWHRESLLRGRAMQVLRDMGLAARSDDFVEDLSFGSARFVELAAVLVERPQLMLLDEPTTGLDLAEVDRLSALLRQARDGGTTVLVVAHDVRFVAELCDMVYVLAQGRVLRSGEPAVIQSDPEVIEAYLGRAS